MYTLAVCLILELLGGILALVFRNQVSRLRCWSAAWHSAGSQIECLRVRWSKITINLYRALNISEKSWTKPCMLIIWYSRIPFMKWRLHCHHFENRFALILRKEMHRDGTITTDLWEDLWDYYLYDIRMLMKCSASLTRLFVSVSFFLLSIFFTSAFSLLNPSLSSFLCLSYCVAHYLSLWIFILKAFHGTLHGAFYWETATDAASVIGVNDVVFSLIFCAKF